MELAKEKFGGDLSDKKALLIGAGEMGELILKYLTKNNIRDITISNRSLINAETVVDRINKKAHIVPLSDIASIAAEVDIIITSVTCHDYLLTFPMIQSIAGKRGGQPLFVIDIAVPRNVDPDVVRPEHVTLYNIDNLKEIADRNLEYRLKEVNAAMEIVHTDANELLEWYEGLEMVPMIVKMSRLLNLTLIPSLSNL